MASGTAQDEGDGPLAGVRVVELGVWVAGPGAGGVLADWGAEVTKVEPPQGDPSRGWQRMLGGDLDSNPVFELDNRGKRSIGLDLSHAEGRAVLDELVADADVFLTNIRASALERLGFGYVELTARHPRLVYAIITGYGLDGDDADRPAYDVAAFWARAGLAASLQVPGGPLPFQRAGMGDHSAAMSGAGMVSAALFARERTGRGQLVSTSLLRQGAYVLGFDVNVALMWGRTLSVGVRETMGNPAVNNYATADGRHLWIVGLDGRRHWPPLARAVGRPEWIDDPRFATPRDRAANARLLIAELDAIFATRALAEWADAFAAEPDVFWSPVNTIEDLLADPQFAAAGGLVEVPGPGGPATMLATPVDFGGGPPRPRRRAPALGEHTDDVLAELGRSAEEIDALRAAGVAVSAPPA